MSTDARELTEDEIYDQEGRADHYDRYQMKIIQNGSFNGVKNAVFLAFVLGVGAVIWTQQSTNAEFKAQIAVLQLECRNNASQRVLHD